MRFVAVLFIVVVAAGCQSDPKETPTEKDTTGFDPYAFAEERANGSLDRSTVDRFITTICDDIDNGALNDTNYDAYYANIAEDAGWVAEDMRKFIDAVNIDYCYDR